MAYRSKGNRITPLHPQGRPERGFILRVDITNSDRRLIDWVNARWSGNVQVARKEVRPEWKPVYHWHAGDAQRVRAVLTAAMPYLVIKRRQAELAIEMARLTRRPGLPGYTPEEVAAKVAIFDEMRALNRKGVAL